MQGPRARRAALRAARVERGPPPATKDDGRDGDAEAARAAHDDAWARHLAFQRLIRLRAHMTALADEKGTSDGTVWGRRTLDATLRASLGAAERWCGAERERLLEGVARFDAALCALLGWDPDATFSLEDLRERHGYPRDEDFWF
jgi:hypothetical protein